MLWTPTDLAAKVGVAYTMGGIAGTLETNPLNTTQELPTCSTNGVTGCVTTTNYVSADLTNLTSTNIRKDISIAGVTGQLNPETHSECSRDGEKNCVAGDDYPAAKLSNINAWDLRVGSEFGGVTGALKVNCRNRASSAIVDFGRPISASVDPTTDRLTVTAHGFANNTAVRIGGDTNQYGLAGLPGGLSLTATYYVIVIDSNTIALAPNSGTGTTLDITSNGTGPVTVMRWNDGILQNWDTIDDFNNNETVPSQAPAGWNSATDCGSEVWADVTEDSCDSTAKDCMVKDCISGLIWSESLPVSGAAPGTGSRDFASAILHCDSLNFGSHTDWRLPTQKELLDAYVHGIRAIGYNESGAARVGGTLDNNDFFIANIDLAFWSSTSRSALTGNFSAWPITLHEGSTPYGSTGWGLAWGHNKDQAFKVICVRP